jgi:hypothetical protein
LAWGVQTQEFFFKKIDIFFEFCLPGLNFFGQRKAFFLGEATHIFGDIKVARNSRLKEFFNSEKNFHDIDDDDDEDGERRNNDAMEQWINGTR